MPHAVPAVELPRLTQINGVRLYTKKGIPRSRYANRDRLQILGTTWEESDAFTDVFCPGEPVYAATRGKSENPRDWATPRVYSRTKKEYVAARLRDEDLLRHLLADMLPGRFPVWVAP